MGVIIYKPGIHKKYNRAYYIVVAGLVISSITNIKRVADCAGPLRAILAVLIV